MPLSDQPGLHERSLMATTSILSSRFPFMLTFHPLPSSRSDTFSSAIDPTHITSLLLRYSESIRLAPSSPRLMFDKHRFRFPPAKSEHARYAKFFPS